MSDFSDLRKKLNGIKPQVGGCHQNKDEVFKYAWDNGCRLFDDGYGYSGRLVNTSFLGQFLKDKNHDDYVIVEKLPMFDKLYFEEFGVHIYEADDKKLKEMVDFIFNFQIKTLGVDYIDCYLLHALDDTQYSDNNYLTKDLYIRLYKILMEYKEKGLIKHLGFSAHIGFYRMFYLCEEFKKALGEGVVDVAEVSYNILNDKGHTQSNPCYFAKQYKVMVWDAIGEEGIKYLKDNGYFVIDCMPHESGRIGQISTAEDWFRWADRFALNNKNIDVVLEGTSYIPHFQMMLEEAGILKREIQEMRDIEGSSNRCHE